LTLIPLAGCMAQAPQQTAQMSAAAEEMLAPEIAGRTAGQPVACVFERSLRGPRSVAPGLLVFDGPGSTIYVNRTLGSCGDLTDKRSVRFSNNGTMLCRGDVAQSFDPYTGIQGDFCNLGPFEPYRR